MPPVGVHEGETLEAVGVGGHHPAGFLVVVVAADDTAPLDAQPVHLAHEIIHRHLMGQRGGADCLHKGGLPLIGGDGVQPVDIKTDVPGDLGRIGVFIAGIAGVKAHGPQGLGHRLRVHGQIQT